MKEFEKCNSIIILLVVFSKVRIKCAGKVCPGEYFPPRISSCVKSRGKKFDKDFRTFFLLGTCFHRFVFSHFRIFRLFSRAKVFAHSLKIEKREKKGFKRQHRRKKLLFAKRFFISFPQFFSPVVFSFRSETFFSFRFWGRKIFLRPCFWRWCDENDFCDRKVLREDIERKKSCLRCEQTWR